jgi:hypothetical protein
LRGRAPGSPVTSASRSSRTTSRSRCPTSVASTRSSRRWPSTTSRTTAGARTHRLHLGFYEAIGEPLECEDPSDRLLDVETQLAWLRSASSTTSTATWKYREMALLAGVKV